MSSTTTTTVTKEYDEKGRVVKETTVTVVNNWQYAYTGYPTWVPGGYPNYPNYMTKTVNGPMATSLTTATGGTDV